MSTFQPINVFDFLKEFVTRLGKKNPKFFTILSYILTAAGLITGIPAFLEYTGVVLPEALQVLSSKVVAYAAAVGVFLTNLTVDDATEVAAAEPEKLPVTAKAENNKVVEGK